MNSITAASVHLFSGLVKLSMSAAPKGSTFSNVFCLYLDRETYLKMGEPKSCWIDYSTPGRMKFRTNRPSSPETPVRNFGAVAGEPDRQGYYARFAAPILPWPSPNYLFRAMPFQASFSRESGTIEVRDPLEEIWRKSSTRKAQPVRRSLPSAPGQAQTVVPVNGHKKTGPGGAIGEAITKVNQGLTLLEEFGVPYRLGTTNNRITLEVGGTMLR